MKQILKKKKRIDKGEWTEGDEERDRGERRGLKTAYRCKFFHPVVRSTERSETNLLQRGEYNF